MKNLSLVLNVILLIAVGILYVFQFSNSTPSSDVSAKSKDVDLEYKVAYINSDSVLVNYDYFSEIQKQLQDKGAQLEKDYQSRAQGLQREVNDFQRTVNSLTIGQAKALEEDLVKKQQNLQLYQQNLSQQLLKEESKLNQELYNKITSYLKEYSAANAIDLVVKYNQGSDVLYANEGMDITQDVIVGLNEAYNSDLQDVESVETDSIAAE